MGQKITIKESLVTIKTGGIHTINTVEIGEQVIAAGAFGSVHDCISVNGQRPTEALYIKILKDDNLTAPLCAYNGIVKLQQLVIDSQRTNQPDVYTMLQSLPALKAFPGFSFRGELNGKEVSGYSTRNLHRCGFASLYESIAVPGIHSAKFKAIPFSRRFQFCFHLANGFNFLSGFNYVHADINPKNIFINTETGELAVIDYDGGGVLERPGDFTLTHGKLEDGEWLSPEIYEQLATHQEPKPDEYSDRWSVSVAYHYLLFGYDPFFFIGEQSKRCKEDYLNSNPFYPINFSDSHVAEQAIYTSDSYYHTINTEIPKKIHEALVKNYYDGFFKPVHRADYATWSALFKETQSPPVIGQFYASKEFILKGSHVKLSWTVTGATSLHIDNGIGNVTGKNEVSVRPELSVVYCLTASGHFGEDKQIAEIKVFPVPLLEHLKIHTPGFQTAPSSPLIIIEPPVVILSIPMEKASFSPTPVDFVPLSTEFIDLRSFYKKRSVFWNLSRVFQKIKQVISSN